MKHGEHLEELPEKSFVLVTKMFLYPTGIRLCPAKNRMADLENLRYQHGRRGIF